MFPYCSPYPMTSNTFSDFSLMETTPLSLADGSLKSCEQLGYSVKNYPRKAISYFDIYQDYVILNVF